MVKNSNPAPRYIRSIGYEVISLRLHLEGKSGRALLRLPSVDFVNQLLQSPGAVRGAAYKLFKFSTILFINPTSHCTYIHIPICKDTKMFRGSFNHVNQLEWLYIYIYSYIYIYVCIYIAIYIFCMFRWEPSPATPGQTSGTTAGTVLP